MTTASVRVVVADDEPLARAAVRAFLDVHPDVQIVAETTSGRETAHALRALRPDLAFLDVAMPAGSGLDAAREHPPPAVVFVTAYDEHALRAFEVAALDYLVKPFDRAQFDRALDRARQRLGRSDGDAATLDRMAVRHGDLVSLVPAADLLAVEATGDYVTLHTAARTFLYDGRLYELAGALAPALVQVHRSWLVRPDAVAEVRLRRSGDGVLTLDSGLDVRASRTYRDAWSSLWG